jgi:ABC-type antimicrobial peptide transport system permease subunit
MALGAGRGAVVSLVMRDVLAMLCWGLAAGLLMALSLARFLAHLFYRVNSTDALATVSAAMLLAGVALAAGLVPCLRALAVSPSSALRCS